MIRLKSSLWVKAYVRTCFLKGTSCTIARKGDGDAGQIYIKCNHMDGHFSLYGPALGYGVENGLGHKFEEKVSHGALEEVVDTYLQSQTEFDPDIWVIELDSKSGELFLDQSF